jgi:hypothetical protein
LPSQILRSANVHFVSTQLFAGRVQRRRKSMRTIRQTSATIALIAVALIGPAAQATANEAPPLEQSAELEAPKIEGTTLLTLDRGITLQDAETIARDAGIDLIGVRYENEKLVGEYFFTETTATFLKTFALEFGEHPRVIGLITPGAIDERSSTIAPYSRYSVPTSIGTFVSEATYEGEAWNRLREAPPIYDLDGDNFRASSLSWAPGFAEYINVNLPNNRALVWQRFVWSGGDRNPTYRDLNFGLEFEVFQNQPGLAGNRPACSFGATGTPATNYKNLFWAQNQGYNWTLFYTNGFSASQLGAYADTQDVFDNCADQGMAVGLRSPGLVSSDGVNFELAIRIDAPRGAATTNKLGAYIQTVESGSCDLWPWNGTPHTDCMGLDTTATPTVGVDLTASYTMANISTRNLWAPDACWNTINQSVVDEWNCNDL